MDEWEVRILLSLISKLIKLFFDEFRNRLADDQL